MCCWEQYNISSCDITSGSSCTSLTDIDDDRPFKPGSETELTEPECPPPVAQKVTQRKPNTNTVIQSSQENTRERRAPEPSRDMNISNVELAHQAHYQDPADDTDEDLFKVPEDYSKSKNTKLNLRLKERWVLVEKDPELQSAIRWRVDLETQCDDCFDDPTLRAMLEYQEHKVNNLHRHLQDRRRKEARREFSQKQAMIDIERLLTSGAVCDEPAHEMLWKEFTMPSEQILLMETFFTWLTTDSLEDEWARCNKAVAAGIQYCSFQEGGCHGAQLG